MTRALWIIVAWLASVWLVLLVLWASATITTRIVVLCTWLALLAVGVWRLNLPSKGDSNAEREAAPRESIHQARAPDA